MEKREVRFDGWRVNFDSGEVTKGGDTHRLQDQPLHILDELTLHAGEVVTREQLIARLWPKGVVEYDTGLNTAMRKLRISLGDEADTPRYIETIPRKGYRFIGTLESDPAASLPSLPTQYVPTSFETGAVIGRRASDRRAPLKRLAWGFGSIMVAVVLAIVAWRMPGAAFEVEPPDQLPTVVVLPLVDMSVEQNRAGAVRRPHRRTLQLAGPHSNPAGRGAYLGVRIQGFKPGCAGDRQAAGCYARTGRQPATLR